MRYMGSKARLAKEILPIILKDRQQGQWYVEPFAGGFNMIDKVAGPRIANDINPYTTALFKALQKGWVPPEFVSELEYKDIKDNQTLYPPELVGFVGFGCSFGGKFWGGYARDKKQVNYARQSRDSVLKQNKNMVEVVIHNLNYQDLILPPSSLVYCDPPYEGTTKYKSTFDHREFWGWVRSKTSEGHKVYVSEYNAPGDFKCIWQKEVKISLVSTGAYNSNTERLFTML